MIVKLLYEQIVSMKKKYHETPAKLKNAVRQMLIDNNHEDLIDE